jgi:hypothetical protein
MVRAIREGRKTQTRRVVKDATWRFWDCAGFTPTYYHGGIVWHSPANQKSAMPDIPYSHRMEQRCPFGGPEDRLWVRETWREMGSAQRTDGGISDDCRRDQICYRADVPGDPGPWRPSIFMPRRFSRITLEITEVRVQRVQDISEADAMAEGVVGMEKQLAGGTTDQDPDSGLEFAMATDARFAYQVLWDSINTARGYGWDHNPWVWALTFRMVEE